MAKPKFTIRKAHGDDAYSWAVFKDGHEIINGLTQSTARYELHRQRELVAAQPKESK